MDIETQNKIQALENKLLGWEQKFQGLEQEVRNLKTQQLRFPLDVQSKKVIENILENKVLDVVWSKFFYYPSFFESLTGWSLTDSSGNSHCDADGLHLETGGVATNKSSVIKMSSYQNIINFWKTIKFHTDFNISSVTAVEADMGVGEIGVGMTTRGFGFVVDNATLKAVSQNGTSQTSITLQTINNTSTYSLEAIFYPSTKIVFFVDGVEMGTITTNLPQGSVTTEALGRRRTSD